MEREKKKEREKESEGVRVLLHAPLWLAAVLFDFCLLVFYALIVVRCCID